MPVDFTAGAEGAEGAAPADGEEAAVADAAPAPPEEAAPPPPPATATMYRLHVHLDQVPQQYSGAATFYFLRASDEPLTAENMEGELEFGVLAEGPSLHTLQRLLAEVYLPLLAQEVGVDEDSAAGLLSMGSEANTSQRELLSNMQKFLGQVRAPPRAPPCCCRVGRAVCCYTCYAL